MKAFIYVLLLFSFSSLAYSQTEDTIMAKDSEGEDMLIGNCVREDFQDTSFASWFDEEYSGYKINTAVADSLMGNMSDINIVLIMGTWCSDSRREVPRFFKVLDYLKYPSDQVKMKCVDREMKTLSNDIDVYGVDNVPTFIFFRNGDELGRIIEAPDKSFEEDMADIILTNE